MNTKSQHDLVKGLTLARLKMKGMDFPAASALIDSLSSVEFHGLPEFSLVTIFDAYVDLRKAGIPIRGCLAMIDSSRRGQNTSIEDIPEQATIEDYICYRLETEHPRADIAAGVLRAMAGICREKYGFEEPAWDDEICITMPVNDPP